MSEKNKEDKIMGKDLAILIQKLGKYESGKPFTIYYNVDKMNAGSGNTGYDFDVTDRLTPVCRNMGSDTCLDSSEIQNRYDQAKQIGCAEIDRRLKPAQEVWKHLGISLYRSNIISLDAKDKRISVRENFELSQEQRKMYWELELALDKINTFVKIY